MNVAFGVGNFLKNNIEWIKNIHTIDYLCDNNPDKWGKTFYDIKCISLDELKRKECNVFITVENPNTYIEIKQLLFTHDINVSELYEPLERQTAKKNVMIWGADINEMRITKLILHMYTDVNVVGYVTAYVENIGIDEISGMEIISLFKAENLFLKNEIDGIVAITEKQQFEFVTRENVRQDVLNSGKYYIVPRGIISNLLYSYSGKAPDELLVPYEKSYRLRTLQFTVTAQCNMKCKLCSHFAGLIGENEVYTYEQFEKDIERSRELFDDIESIDIWGGEALLCKDLHKYLYKARELYPNSQLLIGTNGLLVQKMSEELIEAIKTTKAKIDISMYPPTLNIIDDIVKFLKTHQIPMLRGAGELRIKRFFRRFDINGNNNINDAYEECISKTCATIYKGKLCACYFPLFAPFFNKKFGNYFMVDDDVIDLYDEGISKEELMKKLRTPMKSCKYCSPKQYEQWAVSDRNLKMSDYVYCER